MSSNTIRCPLCHVQCDDFRVDHRLLVNHCAACNQIWFDHGELEIFSGLSELIFQGVVDSSQESQTSNATCPRCSDVQLIKCRIDHIYALTCNKCKGNLCKAADLSVLRKTAAQKLHTDKKEESIFYPWQKIIVKQMFELGELFGFETRNKYLISTVNGTMVGFAAEQGKGIVKFVGRAFFGHRRRFEIKFYDKNRHTYMFAVHPFRWFFRECELFDQNGQLIGRIVQRFAIFRKKLTVLNQFDHVLYEINSPIWSPWTFSFTHKGRAVAYVRKRWSGALSELFTDKDNFLVEFDEESLSELSRRIIVASAVFIDILYFEQKAGDA